MATSKKKDSSTTSLLMIIIGALLIILSYVYVFSPAMDKKKTYNDEVKELNNTISERESKVSQQTKYEEDNEKLRKANMELFLKVGSTKSDEEIQRDTTGIEPEEKKQPRKFEDLFDDKGNLK